MTQQQLFEVAGDDRAYALPPRTWTVQAARFIQEKQRQHARRAGLHLVGSRPPRGEPFYVETVEANCPRITEADKWDLHEGDGHELIGKIRCVYSSAALCVNVHGPFRNDPAPLVAALKLPDCGYTHLRFEEKFPCVPGSATCPNLDVVVHGPDRLLCIESKAQEHFSGYGRSHLGERIKAKYLNLKDTWHELPALRAYLERPNPHQYAGTHQLSKHILGARARVGLRGFTLLYLFLDCHGDEAAEHRRELREFSEVVRSDGVSFEWRTYQDLLTNLVTRGPEWYRAIATELFARYC